MKNEELVKQENTALDVAPSHIAEGNQGLENVGPGDSVVPRLLIMQALSPQVQDDLAKPGEALNSLTNEVWIPKSEAVSFTPVFHYKEWIKWAERSSGLGMLDRSLDPASELAVSAARGEKDDLGNYIVTEYHNFICIFNDFGFTKPVLVPCCRTCYKHGKKLLGLARYRGPYPLYAGAYTIAVAEERNKKNQPYFVWNFDNDGWTEKEDYAKAEALYTALKAMQFNASEPVEAGEI